MLKIKHITLIVSLIISGLLASTLKDIKYDPKGEWTYAQY